MTDDRDRDKSTRGADAYDLTLEGEDVDTEAAIRDAVAAVDARRVRNHEDVDDDDPESGTEEDQVQHLLDEIQDLRDRSMRTLADFENYRRRAEREREDQRRFAAADVVTGFLDIVDNLERALAAGGSEADLRQGVEMIHRQMTELLSRYGVKALVTEGARFDPSEHEAVVREELDDVSQPMVIGELQRGYKMYDRLLRPARVRVGVPRSGAGTGSYDDESRAGDAADGEA